MTCRGCTETTLCPESENLCLSVYHVKSKMGRVSQEIFNTVGINKHLPEICLMVMSSSTFIPAEVGRYTQNQMALECQDSKKILISKIINT